MDWKEIRRKVKREEKIFVFIILGIIIVSIIDEVIAKSGYAFLFVLNYESVSLVVIQIQATVQTLSIALLALVSGKSDEYYGAAEPPVRCGESHLSGLTEPPHFVY